MRLLLLFASLLLINGCGGGSSGSSDSSSSADFKPIEASYSLINANSLATIKNVTNATLHIDLGDTPKSLYLVTTSHFDNQTISINGSRSNRVANSDSSAVDSQSSQKSALLKRVEDFKKKTFKLLRTSSSEEDNDLQKSERSSNNRVGSSAQFCVDMDSNYNCTRQISATAVRVKSQIATEQGDKTLVLWLQDGISIRSGALDDLSQIFLQPGLNNDIYDWETSIYSKEWGADAQSVDSNLISDATTIDILVYNMYNGGIAGFYWPKDNFKKSFIAASNEKIMFYINAQLLASNEKETFTTLDHEFQHMIHFYQRAVLKDISDDTWFNEMMSEATEDLLATKIGYKGPRNVDPNDGSAGSPNNDGGRFPVFNANNSLSLISWGNDVAHYGKISSFGTYLLRNYGGAALLHKLMSSNSYDKQALLEATGESDLHKLVNNWGTAVIFSDQTSIEGNLRYNSGTFFNTSYAGANYSLGSINFFNYTPAPKFQNSGTIDNYANLYSKVGENLSGTINLTVNAPKGATLTLIAK
jgi:hypothetical protein